MSWYGVLLSLVAIYFCTCTASDFFESQYTKPLPARIHLFTLIQLSCLGFAWLLNGLAMTHKNLSPLGQCFPIIIMLLVPFRMYVMPTIFTPEELHQLDNLSDTPLKDLADIAYDEDGNGNGGDA